MTELSIIFVLALLVEAIWQALKPLWPRALKAAEKERGVPVDAIGCLIIALLLCFGTRADLLALVGVPIMIPYVGTVLTAVLIYRGSNFLHDVIESINGIKNKQKPPIWADDGIGDTGPVDPEAGVREG